jgi:hypothetical protein
MTDRERAEWLARCPTDQDRAEWEAFFARWPSEALARLDADQQDYYARLDQEVAEAIQAIEAEILARDPRAEEYRPQPIGDPVSNLIRASLLYAYYGNRLLRLYDAFTWARACETFVCHPGDITGPAVERMLAWVDGDDPDPTFSIGDCAVWAACFDPTRGMTSPWMSGPRSETTMNLRYPIVLYQLEHKRVMYIDRHGRADVRNVAKVEATMIATMRRAKKVVFDSGTDEDRDIMKTYRETALNMMDAGLFHLPYPISWVEDPFESSPDNRLYYLAVERDQKITMRVAVGITGPPVPLIVYGGQVMLNLANPTHSYYLDGREIDIDFHTKGHRMSETQANQIIICGNAVYSLKKLLVSLATEQVIKERKNPPKVVGGGKVGKSRRLPYTVVRVPLDDEISVGASTGTGTRRRKHLVRGYVWGKNTRPVEEQRWIKPFFRGSREHGEIQHTRVEVLRR